MVIVRHAVGVCKMRAGAAQLRGARVHALDKGAYRAGNVLGDDVARLVCRGKRRAVEKIAQAHRLAAVNIRGRAVMLKAGFARCRGRHHIVGRSRSGLYRLDGQQQRHYLRKACRLAARVCVDIKKYPAAAHIAEQRALCAFELRRAVILGEGAGERHAQHKAQAYGECRYAQFHHYLFPTASVYTIYYRYILLPAQAVIDVVLYVCKFAKLCYNKVSDKNII